MASVLAVALNAQGQAPEWVKVLPAGVITTVDGRGPYRVADMATLATQSLKDASGELAVDENHSTDLAAPKGGPSPARGWITELQAREDGLWGKVDWNASGKQLLADKAYRGISPVFLHSKDGEVLRILRVSLTNTPNLRGLAALHMESTTMEELLKKLRSLLGLADDADGNKVYEAVSAVMSAATAEKAKTAAGTTALASIAKAAGIVKDGVEVTAELVVNAVRTLATAAKEKPGADAVTALQTELTTVTTQLTALQTSIKTTAATAFVDAAIAAGRVGVKPLREHYIAQHAIDAPRVEKEINAMPVLGRSGALETPPKDKDGVISLNAEQELAAKALGLDPKEYLKTLTAEKAVAA